MEKMKGYKVFNPDWTCRGFQYEVGKTYTYEGEISLCGSGFHFCPKLADCFSYYAFNGQNKVAEVIAEGETIAQDDDNKAVTNKITIVRELSWHEVLDMVNTGKNCTGLKNSGYCNSGYCNSGYCNSGYYNTGDCNSGYCNSGNYNSGFFNTITPKATFFNKPTDLSFEKAYALPGMYVLRENFSNNIWITSSIMSDEEKQAHPEHETCGGYLKVLEYKDAWREMWDKLSEDEKAAVKALPNFDSDVFYEITGIKVE